MSKIKTKEKQNKTKKMKPKFVENIKYEPILSQFVF